MLVRTGNLISNRRNLRKRFAGEVYLQPHDIAVTSVDEAFLQRVLDIVNSHIDNEAFSVEQLGREVGMSRSQIHRKLKALTDQSATQFINSIRMQRAMILLQKNAGTVAEIGYQVGFASSTSFIRAFNKQFGYSPGEVQRRARAEVRIR